MSLASRRALFSAALAAPVLVVACGSRGPLDIDVIREVPDASATLDAPADVPGETSDGAAHDAIADVVDAAPEAMGPDAGPIPACFSCISQNCGQQFLTCITSTGCAMALQCVVQTCLAGGGAGGLPNLQCISGCAGGDATTQMQVLSVFGCVIGSCAQQCAGALGGLGGLGGGGGGGGGGGAGG